MSDQETSVAERDGDRRDGDQRDQSISMAISNEMVRIYKTQFGRGPTKARTNWAGPDVITVILEETLTPAERNLLKMGEHQRLRDLRIFFQYATVRGFCEPIERLTGRKVRAFVSGMDTIANGLATEVFVLHPEGYDGPSRIDEAEADETR
jgi:uncharacterized protein YbcI